MATKTLTVRNNSAINVPTSIDAKIVNAIKVLEAKKTGKWAGLPGVHTVFSGLNAEVYRVGLASRETIAAFWSALEARNVVQVRGAKGGAIVYVYGTMPASKTTGKAEGLLS